jgi:predicted N-acetyltransferase YhbS
MPISYKMNETVNASDVIRLFQNSGINRPIGQPERIQKMLDNANLVVTAWDGDRLVGIARALTDFCYCCYLSDLAVDRNYQRQGIGRTLIGKIREAIGDETMLLLLSAPGAMDYYPRVGFQKAENGFIIPRAR